MSRHRILVSNRQRLVRFPAGLVRSIVELVLDDSGLKENCEVSILLCRDPLIRTLNRDYRGVDRPTDVLAFAQSEDFKIHEPQHQKYILLGDVVISADTAVENAERFDASPGGEIARLIIHGTLHLLGWDDSDPASRSRMRRKEKALLEAGGLDFK